MASIAFCSSPFTNAQYRNRSVHKCVRRASFRASTTTSSAAAPDSTSTPTVSASSTSLGSNEIEAKAPQQGNIDLNLGDVTSVDDINAIMQLTDEFDIADLRIESGGVAVEITREGGRGFVDGVLRDEPQPVAVAPAQQMIEVAQAPTYSESSIETESVAEVEDVSTIEPQPISAEPVANDSDPNMVYDSDFVVKSNRVGFFFSGARNKPPLVNVGDHVAFNQPVCIIEQLGQQYVYLAEVSGTITKIFVEDGDAVQFDDHVMVIRPD